MTKVFEISEARPLLALRARHFPQLAYLCELNGRGGVQLGEFTEKFAMGTMLNVLVQQNDGGSFQVARGHRHGSPAFGGKCVDFLGRQSRQRDVQDTLNFAFVPCGQQRLFGRGEAWHSSRGQTRGIRRKELCLSLIHPKNDVATAVGPSAHVMASVSFNAHRRCRIADNQCVGFGWRIQPIDATAW